MLVGNQTDKNLMKGKMKKMKNAFLGLIVRSSRDKEGGSECHICL